jgi:DNA processing protein
LLVLLSLASLTARRLLELAQDAPSARACLAAVKGGRAGSDADRAFARSIDPAAVQERIRRAGAQLIAVGDPEYPSGLLDLFDPPAGLFVAGRSMGPPEPRVALVGARRCSVAGREIAGALAGALAAAGACVVSGGAIGIDAAAHQGALDADGATIAVLGCGLDVVYPRANSKLLEAIGGRGSLVSEYPPGTPAEPFRFPARNRIVAALASAVVVVEGAEGSGAMITAEHGLELGRDVLAVPGPVTSPLSRVPNTLIREGAGLIRDRDDLLGDLGLIPNVDRNAAEGGVGAGAGLSEATLRSLSARERSVWDVLVGPASVDSVALAARASAHDVAATLVELELRGLVRQVGGRYERRLVH